MTDIRNENVIDALRKVNDPDLHKDLVTLNMIKDVKIEGSNINVTVELTTPACPLKDKIREDCIAAIKNDIPAAEKIEINMTSNVRSHKDSKKDSILPGVKNTIAVASGKGGVGKSTVAVNLAVALAKDGAKVGLIDADIYGPSIPMMLGIEDKPKIYQSAETKKMMPLENYGVKLMSIGFLVDDDNPVIWRGPMASGAVKQFMTDVDWGELDYMIFDLPPGTGDIQLTLVQTIPLTGAVIVTTPQEVSLVDARKGLKMFNRVNVPVFGIIENMSYFIAPDTGTKYDIFGNGGGEKLANELKTQFLGGIAIDPRIRQGGDSGKPIVYDLKDTEHDKMMMKIARNLAAEVSITNINKGSDDVEIILND
ncbi:MAG: iron-sulfur cluster carrier protein ApbC [Melioribacteraceae bacterium]|nr:iron-sulfur cluster carrier protein ApbC [Melioribacteraceae bacterium]MCF8353512.1 iron-sulfur cluster carrier protein ApbC [Melioribacteraceae bacterium]MCF8392641.1 iron-sulfur cluster carrier protein ApbC [Melioribacteraceae bacterium]MCF8418487.1 iron-sulfur cluster carrier protein ApbC [Melioribacteraceae bacterium]